MFEETAISRARVSDFQVPFTPQISVDERERHEPRIREWIQRELRVIFYNPSEHVTVNEQMLRKLSADIYSMTQNYPINAPQFSVRNSKF